MHDIEQYMKIRSMILYRIIISVYLSNMHVKDMVLNSVTQVYSRAVLKGLTMWSMHLSDLFLTFIIIWCVCVTLYNMLNDIRDSFH